MKLKYNHDGQTLSIPLTDTKPAGKSFAVRHNGTTYYAPLVPVDNATATDCTVTIGGQSYALSRGVAANSVTLDGATEYNVTAEDRQRGVTVTDFSNAVNITGLTFSDIKTCSYSNRTITLGLVGKVKIILPNATSNALKFNGKTVYVGDNIFFDQSDYTIADDFSLTAYNGTGINKSGIGYNLYFDASNVKKDITIQGGNGIDTIISGTGNNSLIGNNGADIFVYSGGNDTIGDYTSKDDDISLKADGLLDFTNYTFSGDNVIISGSAGNSLTILNGKGNKLTVIDARGNKRDYSYKEPEPESDGVLNEPQTAITLPASRTKDFTPTAEKYPRLATIDASAVTVPIAVSAVDSIASCLIAGATGISLFGGNKGDTLYSGTGNSTLTGGTGADMFVHEGGADVITDYTIADKDKVSLASGNMGDISGISVGSDNNISLEFGDNGSIVLQNVSSSDKVTFASAIDTFGTGYFFGDGSVKTAAGYGVTLTAAKAVDLNADTKLDTVIANAGGTITGSTRTATLGGSNVSIVAGDGKETFLYKGGTMNISGYGSTDKVSLASGYTVSKSELNETEKTFTLTVAKGTDTQTITFEGAEAKSFKTVKVNDATITIPYTPEDEPMIFDRSNPAGAANVSVNVQTADFGVFSVDETVPSDSIGSEYYASLVGITATKEDSTIVGTDNANIFYIKGGASNVLTGGLKNDTFIFAAGGGVITDFGIGTTKDGANKYLATTTKRTAASTYVGYNRTNPLSYAQGTDVLKVDGTVVEIAFRQDGGDYDSSTESSFTAYVTYVAGGKYSTIALANIAKKTTKTDKDGGGAGAFYTTNLEQMQGSYTTTSGTTATCTQPQIYDTSTGTSAQLTGTALTDLFVDKSNSAHSSAIAALDAIIQARGITTYSTTAPYYIASVSNGIVAK